MLQRALRLVQQPHLLAHVGVVVDACMRVEAAGAAGERTHLPAARRQLLARIILRQQVVQRLERSIPGLQVQAAFFFCASVAAVHACMRTHCGVCTAGNRRTFAACTSTTSDAILLGSSAANLAGSSSSRLSQHT